MSEPCGDMYEFSLILKDDPDDEQADRLYAAFQDGTIATISGVPRIHFHREAATLMDAIRSAIRDIRSAGAEAVRIEMEPEKLLAEASP